MKKYDLLWLLGIAVVFLILLLPASHAVFMAATAVHPYLIGFVKFSILATMGELLALAAAFLSIALGGILAFAKR